MTTPFIRNHSPESLAQLDRFINTVFHDLAEDEHIFCTSHQRYPDENTPWWGVTLPEIREGSRLNTYHVCMATVRRDDEGKIRRRSGQFHSLRAVLLDDIGTRVQGNDLPPNFRLETSEGNYQYVYVLAEPITQHGYAQQLIQAVYNRSMGLTDPGGNMVMKLGKLPVGRNLKPGRNNWQVRLDSEGCRETPYTFEELVEGWRLTLGERVERNQTDAPDTVEDDVMEWLIREGHSNGRLSGTGYASVPCPLGHEHSDGNDTAGYSPLGHGPDPSERHFHCFHAHSGEPVDTVQFLLWVQREGGGAFHLRGERFLDTRTESIRPTEFPETRAQQNGNIRVLKSDLNVEYMMQRYGLEVKYDQIQHDEYCYVQGEWMDSNSFIVLIRRLCVRNRLPDTKDFVLGAIYSIARRNPCNAVVDYLETLEPETGGIDAVAGLLHTHTPEMARRFVEMWGIQCCAAADMGRRTPLGENVIPKYESVLILAGEQGTHKTTWFRMLVPSELRHLHRDSCVLDVSRSDSIKKAVSSWTCELGELDVTFMRSDISHLKGFLSETEDTMRLPYAPRHESFKRSVSFCATVNSLDFLNDLTGNRRFWPVWVDKAVPPTASQVRAFWSECWQKYLHGERWWSEETVEIEAIRQHTSAFSSMHTAPEIEAILETFGPLNSSTMSHPKARWITVRQVCEEADLPVMLLRRVSHLFLAYLREMGAAKYIKKTRGHATKVKMPAKVDSFGQQ